MKDYSNSNPKFSDTMTILETSDTDHADNFNIPTKQLLDNTVKNHVDIGDIGAVASLCYIGADLTERFAEEISGFSDVWAWMKNRIETVNYKGLFIGDYIPIIVNGYTVIMEIAGIDVYYEAGAGKVGHHIDFISRDCYPFTEGSSPHWGSSNNGTSTDSCPYMSSNIKTWLNDTLYGYLPTALKNVITDKYTMLETRYSSSGTLTDSTGKTWKYMGNLWIPTEYEVYGSCVHGTPIYSEGLNVQYPIFMDGLRHRIKHNGNNGSCCSWWLASAYSGYSGNACEVGSNGLAHCAPVTYPNFGVPVCFRISA